MSPPHPFSRFFVAALLLLPASLLPAGGQNVTTYRYDRLVTGINANETILTPANVGVATFGELFSDPVDGQAYAQPLYLSHVTVPGKGTHNVVYVATNHDSVYAFDADTGGDPLWVRSFLSPEKGITSVPQPDVISGDMMPEIGIVSTPVIDPETGTIYLVAKTKETGRGDHHVHYVQKLHALSAASGLEKFDGPGLIGDTTCDNAGAHGGNIYDYNLATAPNTPRVKGTGDGSVDGTVYFSALRANQRASLALFRGVVYVAWSSHGDCGPYHGWVIGFDANTLAPLPNCVWCTTPDGGQGGVWQSGCGPAIDDAGNLFLSTANGSFNGDKAGRNWAQSLLKFVTSSGLSTANPVAGPSQTFDYFTPWNEQDMSNGDVDVGTGGMTVFDVPGTSVPHLVVGTTKEGTYYVMNRDNMGQFDPKTNHVVQRFEQPDHDELMSTPIFFNNTLFYNRNNEDLRARAFVNGQFVDVYNRTVNSFGGRGGGPVISANGTKNGIVWMLNNGAPAELKAYSTDALAAQGTNPPTQVQALYTGRLPDGGIKFTHPLEFNGKVYAMCASKHGDRVTSAHLCVFGLLPATAGTAKPETPTHVQAASDSPGTIAISWVNHDPNVSGFLIERSPVDAPNFAPVGTAGNLDAGFKDNTVSGATAYKYRVTAVNKNGNSDPSAAIDAKSHDFLSEDGLIAYWNLDEENGPIARDVTGHGHDGNLKGEVSRSQGILDTPGLEFHGTGNAQSHIEVPEKPELDFAASQSFSIVVWARPSSLPGHWAGIVTKARQSPTSWCGLYLTPDNHWAFRGPDDTKNLSGGTVIPNSWQQVVAVQDGPARTRALYVNGTLAASAPGLDLSEGTGPLWIGQANADSQAFAGNLDDLRVYNRPLGGDEVKKLYGSYLPLVELVAPADKAAMSGAKDIQFTARASSPQPGVAINEVRFFDNGIRLAADGGNPANWTWRNAPQGDHVITAQAVDSNGNCCESAPVHLKVTP
jgi:hypothetical protein